MEVIIAAIIGILVLIVVVPIFLGSAQKVWNLILEKLGLFSYSDIEKAVICSNYICKLNSESDTGCPLLKSDFKDFCYDFLVSSGSFEEVCSLPSSLGVNSCDPQYPIVIKLDKEQEIKEENLKKRLGDNVLFYRSGASKGFDIWTVLSNLILFKGLFTVFQQLWSSLQDWSLIIIPNEFLSSYNYYTKTFSLGNTLEVLESASIKPGTYYVSSSSYWDLGNRYLTFIGNETPYISLYVGKSIDKKLDADRFYRIEIESEKNFTNEKTGYNYLLKFEVFYYYTTEGGAPIPYDYSVKFRLYNLTSNKLEEKEYSSGNPITIYTNFGYINLNVKDSNWMTGEPFNLSLEYHVLKK